jgi:hypothetical protein
MIRANPLNPPKPLGIHFETASNSVSVCQFRQPAGNLNLPVAKPMILRYRKTEKFSKSNLPRIT